MGGITMEKTREDIIDLRYRVSAVLRKAQCRAVDCDIIDRLAIIEKDLDTLDEDITKIIGD